MNHFDFKMSQIRHISFCMLNFLVRVAIKKLCVKFYAFSERNDSIFTSKKWRSEVKGLINI